MDFAFSEEQQMLRDQARRFMAERFPPTEVVEIVEWIDSVGGGELDILERVRWGDVVELGYLGLSLPTDAGGAGMSFLDEAVVLEELAHGLYPGPYFSTVAVLPGIGLEPTACKRVLAGEMSATLSSHDLRDAPPLGLSAREEPRGVWRLFGAKTLLPDLWANVYVVTLARTDRGDAWFLIDIDEAYEGELSRASTMDATRRFGAIEPDASKGTEARMLTEPGSATEELSAALRARAQAAVAVEAVGVAQKALDLAIEHALQRKQFDKPIGAYQAVSHQIADTYVGVELARSLAYWAAWCVATSDEQVLTAAAAAKAYASEVAVAACERSIQVHGGVGFTWEHVLHRYYKRAQWLEAFGGYPQEQRVAVASALLVPDPSAE